jgi:hypothetical protein
MQIGESITNAAGTGASIEDTETEEDPYTIRILLHDAYVEPMPLAWYLVDAAGEQRRGQADDDGVLVEHLDNPVSQCDVSWSPAEDEQPSARPEFRYSMTVYVNIDEDADATSQVRKRLSNLGYRYDAGDDEACDAAKRSFCAAWRVARANDATVRLAHCRRRFKPR